MGFYGGWVFFVLGVYCGVFLTALIAAAHKEDFEEDEREDLTQAVGEPEDQDQAE